MTPRRKLLIAVILFVSISILFIVLALIFNKINNSSTPSEQTEDTSTSYVDKDSGETVIVSKNVPEGLEDSVLILGVKYYVDYGMTASQYSYMIDSIKDYMKTKKVGNNEAIIKFSVIASSTRQQFTSGSDQTTFLSNIKINDTITYFMTISYTSEFGEDLVVTIYDKEGGTILYQTPPYTQQDSL